MPALLPAGVHVWERGWLSSNNVLLLTPSEAALIDSGYATHADQTPALLQRELHGRRLCWLLNTHLHSDYCGGNAAIQTRHPGVRTLIPPGSAEAVRTWDEARLSYRATGQYCPRFSLDGLLPPGSAFVFGALTWEIHAAPGHGSSFGDPAHDDGVHPSVPVAAALATARPASGPLAGAPRQTPPTRAQGAVQVQAARVAAPIPEPHPCLSARRAQPAAHPRPPPRRPTVRGLAGRPHRCPVRQLCGETTRR